MAALVDTRPGLPLDGRFPRKQAAANELLRSGLRDDSLRLPHQALVEFVAAVTRRLGGEPPLLAPEDARREAEEMLSQFVVLYSNQTLIRTALRGAAAYGLAWFDAHLWAYAEHYGLTELLSEDFQHGRMYGSVRAIDPFVR